MDKQDVRIEVRVPPEMKAQAQAATAEIRGGLSRVVRELLADWLKRHANKPAALPAKK